jgi:membrane-bound ClpP family serine protease
MLSSDKNVENIGQLAGLLKHYLGLQTEYVKLDVIDKVVRLLTAAALAIIFFLLIIAVMLFLSFAAAHWLGQHIGLAPAFCVVGAFHLLLLLLFFAFHEKWIERPLVRFLANLLLSK